MWVPSFLVKLEPLHCCLYLPLQGYIFIYPKWFDVGRNQSLRGGWFFPPVQC